MPTTDVILFTGAASGLGARLAQRLAAAGRTVVATARTLAKLENLAAATPTPKPTAGRIVPLALDVTDAVAVTALVARVEREIGPIDALINNAAVFEQSAFATHDPAAMARIITTNLLGTIFASRAVVPFLLARKSGRIINIASVAGTRGIPTQAAYCASKHGVLGFADALAQELRPHGITVATLCPGGINTPLWSHTPGDGGATYGGGDVSLTMPVDEVCEAVEFILSRRSGTAYKEMVFFPTNEWH